MALKPHTIDIVVADMGRSLAFYRTLGLDASAAEAGEMQTQIYTPGGTTLGLVTEALVKKTNPHWVTPVGQRVTFSCLCDSPGEVNTVYAQVTNAGYKGLKEPWDAVWGQRYAFLQDPDGNRVDIFAPLNEQGEERQQISGS